MNTTSSPTVGARIGGWLRKPFVWALIAIALLLLMNVLKDSQYFDFAVNTTTGRLHSNLLDILRASAPVMLISVGMAMVIATGGIDLSVGSVMAVSGATSMQLLYGMDNPQTVGAALKAVALSLAIGALLGAFSGVLVAYVGLQPFITTLVMMLAGRGLAKVITDGQSPMVSTADAFGWIARGYVFGLPVAFPLAVVIVVAVALLVRRSALGMMIESIGINLDASRMAGVRPRPLLVTVYATSGLLAALAGVFSVSDVLTVQPNSLGQSLEMDAILAVVIGGTSLAGGKFSLGGAVVGALLITTLDKTVVFLGVPSSVTPAFKAVVIIVLCLLQSERVRSVLQRRRSATVAPRPFEPAVSVTA